LYRKRKLNFRFTWLSTLWSFKRIFSTKWLNGSFDKVSFDVLTFDVFCVCPILRFMTCCKNSKKKSERSWKNLSKLEKSTKKTLKKTFTKIGLFEFGKPFTVHSCFNWFLKSNTCSIDTKRKMSDSFFGQFQFLLSQKKVLGNSLCLLVLEKMLFSDEKQIKQQNLQLLLVIFKC
jgi:hypothetical protein